VHHSRQSPRASTATTARLSSFDPSSSRDHRARARVSSFPRHRRLVSTHRRGVTRQPSPGITHLALRWRSLASIALGATRSVAKSPPPPPRAMDALERRLSTPHIATTGRIARAKAKANETRTKRDDATTRRRVTRETAGGRATTRRHGEETARRRRSRRWRLERLRKRAEGET
jgi:hypothetical protein